MNHQGAASQSETNLPSGSNKNETLKGENIEEVLLVVERIEEGGIEEEPNGDVRGGRVRL